MLEIIITGAIGIFAIYIIVNSIRKKAKTGGCDCGSCSAHCPEYKNIKK